MKKALSVCLMLCMLLGFAPASLAEAMTAALEAAPVEATSMTLEAAPETAHSRQTAASVQNDAPALKSIKLSPSGKKKINLSKHSLQVKAKPNPQKASLGQIAWTSSDESVAVVDQNGQVTLVGGGTATIKAAAGSIEATFTLTVVDDTAPASITLKPSGSKKVDLSKGIFQFKATLKPKSARGDLVWVSSDETVATVEGGLVTLHSGGTTTITAAVEGHETIKASAKLTVVDNTEPSGVTLKPSGSKKVELSKGTFQFKATLKPKNAKGDLVWNSSDETVAEVDDNGMVKLISDGTTTITAAVEGYEAIKASATLTVVDNTIPTGVTLKPSGSKKVDLSKGTFQFNATLKPKSARGDLVWSSSNEDVAEVDDNGRVTLLSDGTTTITAAVEGREAIRATATLTVNDDTAPKGISLKPSGSKKVDLSKGTFQFTATRNPKSAVGDLVWNSSNEDVAEVDENGLVKLLADGTTDITVAFEDYPTISAKATLTVVDDTVPRKLTIKPATVELDASVETGVTLSYTLDPAKADPGEIEWGSDNEGVATVASIEGGKIRIVPGGDSGNATITFSTERGNCQAEVKVTAGNFAAPTGISVNPATVSMKSGESKTLKAKLTFRTGYSFDPEVTELEWWSDDDGIVEIRNTEGLECEIAGMEGGETTVHVSAGEGIEATCKVTVKEEESEGGGGEEEEGGGGGDQPIKPTRITLYSEQTTLKVGYFMSFDCRFTPDDAESEVTWSSSDPSIAEICDGYHVRGVAPGKVTITATAENDVEGSAEIEVVPGDPGEILPMKLTLAVPEEVLIGEPIDLNSYLTIEPANAVTTLKWECRGGLAEITEDGVLTVDDYVKQITVRVGTHNGLSARIKIIARSDEPCELLGPNELAFGEKRQVEYTGFPERVHIKWTSSDTTICTVNSKGLLTAQKKPGTVTITAQYNGYTASMEVEVYDPRTA